MLAKKFLGKVATLTHAINCQTFPYMNFCLTAVKAAFSGISVFAGILVFLYFDVQTLLLLGELSKPKWGGEWKTSYCLRCSYVIFIYICLLFMCHTFITRDGSEDFTDLT